MPGYAKAVREWEARQPDLDRSVRLAALARDAMIVHVADEIARRAQFMGRPKAMASVYDDLLQDRWPRA